MLDTMGKTLAAARAGSLNISFTLQAWKENHTYVAYTPELDVSSCGDSLSQAKTRLREAVGLFLGVTF